MTTLKWVEVERPVEGVTVVTLNRPDSRNALSIALIEELTAAIAGIEKTERVLILKGNGPVFCAGLDLKEANDRSQAEKSAHALARLFEVVYHSPLVTIAAVHGAAIAGGAGLMTLCDIVVAAEDTQIGYPETKRGLVAAMVMAPLLNQVDERLAREMLLTGEIISADRAKNCGLVNCVAPESRLIDRCMLFARSALQCAPQANAHTKALIEKLRGATVSEGVQQALNDHIQMRQTDEAVEGIAAFKEKRQPSWQNDAMYSS